MARNTRTPALFPLRLFATLYTDLVRGVPVILWITLLGLGVPGLLQTREWYGKSVLWGGIALVVTYSAYVAEVFRAGIESVHERQRAAARSLGLSYRSDDASVVLPQAVRRVVPPLMNDLVSLQKDVALVSIVGHTEALRRADIWQSTGCSTSHRSSVAALLFLAVSIPLTRLTDYLLQRERRLMSPGRPCDDVARSALSRASSRSSAPNGVLDGIDLDVAATRSAIALIGASGSGKSTLLRCINLLEPVDDGRDRCSTGSTSAEPGLDPNPIRRRIGMVFQSFQPVPAHDGSSTT